MDWFIDVLASNRIIIAVVNLFALCAAIILVWQIFKFAREFVVGTLVIGLSATIRKFRFKEMRRIILEARDLHRFVVQLANMGFACALLLSMLIMMSLLESMTGVRIIEHPSGDGYVSSFVDPERKYNIARSAFIVVLMAWFISMFERYVLHNYAVVKLRARWRKRGRLK